LWCFAIYDNPFLQFITERIMLNTAQIESAISYNKKQAGVLWKIDELPAELKAARSADTAAFALAVGAAQEAKGIATDGKLGPSTLATILGKVAAPVASTVPVGQQAAALVAVCEAEAAKKVREVGGKNAGPDVEKYLHSLGMTKGSPWCAAFVSWCVMTALGLSKPPKWCSGSAVSLFQVAGRSKTCVKVTPVDADFKTKVKAGWIWSRAQDDAAAAAARKGVWCQGHTGVVVKVDDVGFHTIEGNTNAAGSREGDGVYHKTQKWSDAAIIGKTVGWFDPASV
jgi:hypothetical protein